MTNLQAIDLLKNLEQSLDDYCELNDEGKTAFRMAIEALNCSEFTNSSDTISRQAAIDAVQQHREGVLGGYEYDEGVAFVYAAAHNHIIAVIKQLPSAERRGRWKDIPFTARWICSNCDYISEFASFRYCPDCGAKMDDDLEEPAINPCQGCEDYDGRGGCISKGGCGARMEASE